MVDFSKIRAIDIHTHAEEPCGCHSDDGYDDLQTTMAKYFGAPWSHPPTIAQTAAHYREQNIAADFSPSMPNARLVTGAIPTIRCWRRWPSTAMLIPFASIDPWKGKMAVREARRLIEEHGVKGFKFHPTMQGFIPMTAWPTLYEVLAEHGVGSVPYHDRRRIGDAGRNGCG